MIAINFAYEFFKVLGGLVLLFIILIMVSNLVIVSLLAVAERLRRDKPPKLPRKLPRHQSMYSDPQRVYWMRRQAAEKEVVLRHAPIDKYIAKMKALDKYRDAKNV